MNLIKSESYNNVYSYETNRGTLYAFRYNYYDLVGKRHEKQQRGFFSELEAHKAELEAEIKVADNMPQQLVDSNLTIKQWGLQYYEMNKDRWRKSYRSMFYCDLHNYVIPLIGKYQLSEITKMKYNYYFIQPQLKNLSVNTVKTHHRVVMVLLNAAVESGIIPSNRLHGTKLPAAPKRKPLSEPDIRAFNAQLSEQPMSIQLFFKVLEFTGMRKGECLALTWKDIDFQNNTVDINKSRDQYGVGPTKTPAGVRIIAIPTQLTQKLKHYKLAQQKLFLKTKNSFSNNGEIFLNQFNRPFNPYVANTYFNRILKAAKIDGKGYVVHSLRHTHATMLLDAGASPVEVAHRLGHSSPAVTLSIYSHIVAGRDAENAELFAKEIDI